MENNLSVSDLNSYIKGVFEDELILHNLSVYGELFQFSVSGGNTYFTIKENECYLQCVNFGRIEKPEIGSQITVFGSVEFYRKAGKVTFIAKRIEETGKGKQYAEFQAMKERLKSEGLFVNKCAMPVFIRKIAIVTSNRGAVIHDFLSVLNTKHSYIDVSVIQSKVQGENADELLSQAISEADFTKSDLIVIARGGGSAGDLDCFNTEKVVRAIAECKTPTLSAVGHQTDYTLCDLASTMRAGTPSIAAKVIVDINDGLLNKFFNNLQRIEDAVKDKISKLSSTVYMLSYGMVNSSQRNYERQLYKIRALLESVENSCVAINVSNENKIKHTLSKLQGSINIKYSEYDKKLALSVAGLEFNNPLKILSQGYTLVTKNGENVKSASSLNKGDNVELRFCDGRVCAEIKEK